MMHLSYSQISEIFPLQREADRYMDWETYTWDTCLETPRVLVEIVIISYSLYLILIRITSLIRILIIERCNFWWTGHSTKLLPRKKKKTGKPICFKIPNSGKQVNIYFINYYWINSFFSVGKEINVVWFQWSRMWFCYF